MILRMGLPPDNVMRKNCGACNFSMEKDPLHYLACLKRRNRELGDRHNEVTIKLAIGCAMANCNSRREPSRLDCPESTINALI